jgi:hypothetical protein
MRGIENEVLDLVETSGELDGSHYAYTATTALLDNACGLIEEEWHEKEAGMVSGLEKAVLDKERNQILDLRKKCEE